MLQSGVFQSFPRFAAIAEKEGQNKTKGEILTF